MEQLERLERLEPSLNFGVLAGELRGLPFQSLLLPLQPRLSGPGALEIVADFHMQPAQRLGLELDEVAILERIETR